MKHLININLFFNPEEVEVGDEIEIEGGGELEAPEVPEMPEMPELEAPETPEIPAEEILDDEDSVEEIEADLEPEEVELTPEMPGEDGALSLPPPDKQPLEGPQIPDEVARIPGAIPPKMMHIKSLDDLIKNLTKQAG